MVTELILAVMVVWLVFKAEKFTPKRNEKLTSREEQELIDEWQPEPLVPHKMNLWSLEPIYLRKCGVCMYLCMYLCIYLFFLKIKKIKSGATAIVTASDSEKEYIHLGCYNYLGFAHRSEVKKAAVDTIRQYAVGSCGPRGFYGTMDIHLQLEQEIGEYFGAACIIYPDYMGCNASVITAFAKRGDLLLMLHFNLFFFFFFFSN
ncbi:serine palmitoyltransferase 1, partial [Reticulomyxa filosa]